MEFMMNKIKACISASVCIIALNACATQVEDYASLCFDSQQEAQQFGEYLWNQGLRTRTGEMLYGEPRRVAGLGVLWRGMDSPGECPVGEYPLRITYEPPQDAEFSAAEVLASARVVAIEMRGEYRSIMPQSTQ